MHVWGNQLLPQLLLKHSDTLHTQYRHIGHLHEGVWCHKNVFWQNDSIFDLAICFLFCFFVPPTEGGHIAFGADPVGVGVASRLHSISWTNRWILTKFAQTHYWEGVKKWLDFGDLDLIFKVTPALWLIRFWPKKACLHPISWTKMRILAKLHIYCNTGMV